MFASCGNAPESTDTYLSKSLPGLFCGGGGVDAIPMAS